MRCKRLFTGFIVGSLVGGVVTLLATPLSGSDLRKTCKRQFAVIKNNVKQVSDEATEVINEIKGVRNVGTDLKDSIDEWQKDITPSLEKLKDDVDALQRKIEKITQQPNPQNK